MAKKEPKAAKAKATSAVAKAVNTSPIKAKPSIKAKSAPTPPPPAPPAKMKEGPKGKASKSDRSGKPGPAKDSGQAKADLITLGRSKGFLTYDDVADALPADSIGPDQMDDMLSALDSEDIAVVESSKSFKSGLDAAADEDLDLETDDEDDEDSKVPTRADLEAASAVEQSVVKKTSSPSRGGSDEDQYKSYDPVRMYLRKMGSVALLTREGEVEIAKRIEEGDNEVLASILSSPIAVREIIDIGERLRNHKIRVKDIVRDAEDEEQEFDE